ncbi:MAG TPA: hypothetical protein PKJ51_02110 [Methanothrix sp.]|nr:hypothetical protein [Methanothrix sp.]
MILSPIGGGWHDDSQPILRHSMAREDAVVLKVEESRSLPEEAES